MRDHKPSRSARAFVLAGPALALAATVVGVIRCTGFELIQLLWLTALAWAVFTALACVLWRGLRHGDCSAFSRYELPEDTGERFDWETRTGRYAWRRDFDEEGLHDHLGDHGPIT